MSEPTNILVLFHGVTGANFVTPADQVTGTTPFGAATIGGGGGERPNNAELTAAKTQGEALAKIAAALRNAP